MKVLIFFIGLVAYATCSDSNHCYAKVKEECDATGDGTNTGVICDSKYGAIGSENIEKHLQSYANDHIRRSFEYLLMSTHFANVEKSRDGFEKLYRKMADDTWNDAINLIKHITKRGGSMNFAQKEAAPTEANPTQFKKYNPIKEFDLYELPSLGVVLDAHKDLAEKAHGIHREVTRHPTKYHDPEISHYLEEKFVVKHAGTIRDLAGHVNDLKRLLTDNKDSSLSLFLFDEYLQKA